MRIAAIRLVCRNVARSARFYEEAFGCAPIEAMDPERAAAPVIGLGAERLQLVAATKGPERADPEGEDGGAAPSNASTFQHCAIIVSRMEAAMEKLSAVDGWTAISVAGPERLPKASGGATAFKFRDPDGHPLEFLEFPEDAVPERWRDKMADGPCLGIDHSAITVANVDRSIAFYQALGFRLAGRQRNEGAEQGRMDGLGPFALCDVVTLKPPGDGAPHLELLGYGDPAVVETRVADGSPLATTLLLEGMVPRHGLLRDPDGHRLQPMTGRRRMDAVARLCSPK
nr:VOC family protein [Jiella mangrovi]